MAPRRKIRLVHAWLVVFTLWPLVHVAVVKRWDASPWKLAGFGMYATPRFGLLGMEVFGRVRGTGEEQQLTAPTPELQALASDYLERHRWLGRLAGADDLGAAILELHPEWDRVRILVFRPELDRASAMVVMTQDEAIVGAVKGR